MRETLKPWGGGEKGVISRGFEERLLEEYPLLHPIAVREGARSAVRLLSLAGGDPRWATYLSLPWGALALFGPYLQSLPFLGSDEGPARREVALIVHTLNHIWGYHPPLEEAQREIQYVLDRALDVEKVVDLFPPSSVIPSPQALLAGAPLSFDLLLEAARRIPPPVWVAVGGVALATLSFIPMAAGASIAWEASKIARLTSGSQDL